MCPSHSIRYVFIVKQTIIQYSLSCLHQVKSHLDEILVTLEYEGTIKREIMGIYIMYYFIFDN